MAQRARFISLEVHNLIEERGDLRGRHRGSVAVGCGPSVAGEILALATRRTINRSPNLHATVVEGMLEILLPSLRSGQIDFMIGTGATHDDLEGEPLFEDEVAVTMRVDHPLAKARKLALAALAECDRVLADEPDSLRQDLVPVFRTAAARRRRGRCYTNYVRYAVESANLSRLNVSKRHIRGLWRLPTKTGYAPIARFMIRREAA